MGQQKHQILVLEGSDGTGKTTLAKRICEETGAHYMHLTYRWKDRMAFYHMAEFERALKRSEHQPVVIDRWYPSELIYAKAYRGRTAWPYMYRMLDRVALKHQVGFIMCLPSDKAGYLADYERLKGEREEMYDSGMDRVYNASAWWWSMVKHRPDWKRFDRFDTSLFGQAIPTFNFDPDLPSFIMDTKDRRFAGNPYADTLFVGDRSNQKTRRLMWPFVDIGFSSAWITETFAEMGVPENKIGWLNMYNELGELQWTAEELAWFTKAHSKRARPAKIYAMGHQAEVGLQRLGLLRPEYPTNRIAHPQWFNRFHHHDKSPDMLYHLFKNAGLLEDPHAKARANLGIS